MSGDGDIAIDAWTVDPAFNRQRTVEPQMIGGTAVDVVTSLVVETARPIVLTQDPGKADAPDHQFVPESANLKVIADHVTILGQLKLPGRVVEIFARVLHARCDGDVEPAIVVDGSALPPDVAEPRALPKGAPPPDNPAKIKVAKGNKGDDGYNDRVQPLPLASEGMGPGQAGWSISDHPSEMNGEPGADGVQGLGGGAVFVLCNELETASPLHLSAIGGQGGSGQPGQQGADGGDGGRGFSAKVETALIGTYRMSTAGGPGGRGGRGGDGGRAGQGGDGGTIVVHCVAAAPSVTTSCDGGPGGAPGPFGRGGSKGWGGQGGAATWVQTVGSLATSREIAASPAGPDGLPGPDGELGADPPDPTPGSASVTDGAVTNAALAAHASVSQLQMLLERTRADYLVSAPPCYSLRVLVLDRAEDITEDGRNLVVAAAVGPRLHVRVFDAEGTLVVDAAESEFAGNPRFAALKDALKSLGVPFVPVFELTPRAVLLKGGWIAASEPEPLEGWRSKLLRILASETDIRGRDGFYASFGDRHLSGLLATTVYLSETRAVERRALQRMTPERQKLELIDVIEKSSELGYQAIAGLPIDALLEVGVQSSDVLRRHEQLGDPSADDQQHVIALVGLLFDDADWSRWYRIQPRLDWIVGISNKIPEKHPQKLWADAVCQSAWTLLNNNAGGLDCFGRTPRYTPILSLDTYLTALAGSLTTLKDIEEKSELYFGALRDQKDATNDLQAVVNQTAKAQALTTLKRDKTVEAMNETSNTINRLDAQAKSSRTGLKQQLDVLHGEVRKAFGLSPETFLNCLFQLAFINVHEPANALDTGTKLGMAGGMGLVQAGAMGVSQIGLMVKEAKENILTNSGERINQKFLLEQIDTIADGADLQAEFSKRANGTLSKEGSTRLLVDLAKFRDLCKQFYGLANAREVREVLDAYVDTITERNRYIDFYNLLVGELLDASAELKRLKGQRDAVQAAIATKSKPGLPATATFVSGLYERAKANCVADLYHAHRAYAYWALEPFSGFYDKIGRSPDGINHAQLNVAKSDLGADIVTALAKNYRTPNRFPASEENESSIGRAVVLTKHVHPDFFEDLWDCGEAEFELELAGRRSVVPKSSFAPTVAAWSHDRPSVDETGQNPFAGMADVRLTKVRVWLVGTKESTLDHKVVVTHLGSERFRTPDDESYPDPADPYLLHEPVSIPFNYNAKGLRYDERTCAFAPGKLFGGVVGTQDGDLGFPKGGIVDLPAAGKFAPIGPFARWRIEVPDNLNPRLKLTDLHAVVIDFHGFHQSYSARA